jgi:hypothetical protein
MILFVTGAAVFVYGILTYNSEQASLAGAAHRLLGGSSPAQKKALAEMVGGGAVGIIGMMMVAIRRGSSRRR